MNLDLIGKKALITGASQGIGLEIAQSLSQEGVQCILLSRSKDKLTQAIKGLSGTNHSFIVHDLEDKADINSLLESNIIDTIDICIHNLGGTLGVKSAFASYEDWLRVWNFNVGISIDINNKIVPHMVKRGFGRIICVSSISGESLRGSGAYAASKAYLNAYIKILGRALGPSGVVVCGVLPGAIYTKGGHWDEESPHNKINLNEFYRKKEDFLRHHQAIGRLGLPEEIAPMVAFLCSKHASFANGSLVSLDGGTM